MAQHYDKQFKLDAIKYREDHPELTIAAVCRNLGISQPTYYIWLRQFKENGDEIEHRGSGNYSSDLEKENAQLKRELKAQKDALEILKKAIGILGEEPK
ncbi:MAG: transposase [Candidatus Izemoplasmatales bacterium]|nr:transposase [Candidatus Izemoplasmatales bacterium]